MTAPTRSPATALFWRLLLLNALVLVIAAAVLALSPLTVSAPVLITEVSVLAVGLVLMLVATAVLLRASLRPLDGLAELMQRVDLLRPGERLAVRGNGDVAHLVHTFNDMLDRLESERGTSTARALAAQEGERQRIAQELHDEIGQSLTVVLLGLKRVLDRAPDELRDEVSTAAELTRGSLDEVRRVARRLRPGVLEDLGLVSALSALATDFAQASEVPVTRTLDQRLPELSRDAELVLYRIAQEGLTNVARHANATRVELALTAAGRGLLRIADDGRGLDGAAEGAASAACGNAPSSSAPRCRSRAGPAAAPTSGCSCRRDHPHPAGRRPRARPPRPAPDPRRRARPAVVAEAGDGAEAVEKVAGGGVDLAILDIAMPRMTGLQAAREMTRRASDVRILMLSMYDNEQYFFEALKAGASGYVLKSVADQDLVAACRAAMRGEPFLYAGAISALIRDYLMRSRQNDRLPESILTPREEEIVKLIAEGNSSKEIAATLVISIKTVDRHRANILAKLGMRDRLDLTRYAIRAGLVEP